eukprot:TRINITY_DN582_c0_g1_i2.p1 TRINITY_DN582_c0_g1~~TRINITY_DN582_c0_g1_i2.p1  ORF type:complete len:188 (+),score=22.32 TRINITY_DN582_c0_g1_i2:148-711(+)
MCCGARRAFRIHINDVNNKPTMIIERGVRCVDNWLLCIPNCCFQQDLAVMDGSENVIGRVKQVWNCCRSTFALLDSSDNTVLEVSGPACNFQCCCADVHYKLERDGERVGEISKNFSGILKEAFTDADNFTLQFEDVDMKPDHKALALAAVFLIDFMFLNPVHDVYQFDYLVKNSKILHVKLKKRKS